MKRIFTTKLVTTILLIYSLGITVVFIIENKRAYHFEQKYHVTNKDYLKYRALYTACTNTDVAKKLDSCLEFSQSCQYHLNLCKFLYKRGCVE
jgi:hypothetical protein